LKIASLTEKIRDIFCNTPDLFNYLVAISTFILINRHGYFFVDLAAFLAGAAFAAALASDSTRTDSLVSVAGIAIEVRSDRIPARTATPPTSAQFTSITETSWLVPKRARAVCATVLMARSPAEAQKAVLVNIYCFLSL
jgi:hypothetical protein